MQETNQPMRVSEGDLCCHMGQPGASMQGRTPRL